MKERLARAVDMFSPVFDHEHANTHTHIHTYIHVHSDPLPLRLPLAHRGGVHAVHGPGRRGTPGRGQGARFGTKLAHG